MYFLWKDEYSIGIEKIDSQHKILFEIGRKLYKIVLKKEDTEKGDLEKVIQELKNYVIYHFREEEKFMMENKYVHFQSHKNQHKFFENEIKRLETKSQTATHEAVLKEVFDFIFTWILNHILKIDMKLRDILWGSKK